MNPLLVKVGIGASALAAGAAFTLSGSSSPAVAYSSPPSYLDISIGSPAHLVAKGAAIQLPVTTICSDAYYYNAYVSVTVTERVSGKKTATGTSNYQVPCTGYRQTNLVTISSQNGISFAKGTAYASGTINTYYSGSETTETTITIKA